MKNKLYDVILGVILIIAGVIFLGNEFEFWDIDLFFKGWWTLFIIVPSVLGLCEKGNKISAILGLLIGVLLLLAARDIITWSAVGKIFLPALLIIVGLSIIFKRSFKTPKIENKYGTNNYTAIFSGTEENISNEKFVGASITAIFGGVELDLRQAIIEKDVVINCLTVFGGIDIMIPDNVKIKTSGVPVFGGIENKKETSKEDKEPTVYINYVCVFAGVDLK